MFKIIKWLNQKCFVVLESENLWTVNPKEIKITYKSDVCLTTVCGDFVKTFNKLPSVYTTHIKICYMYDKDFFLLNS
jgi:hypothetical protein